MIGLTFNVSISVMGKAEGHGENWHGHVTALTVSPDYRRLGLAATLMNFLENVSEKYVNLFIFYFPFSIILHHSKVAGQKAFTNGSYKKVSINQLFQ